MTKCNQSGKNNGNYKHGMKGTRFYRIWKEMKTRCYNKNRLYYKNYGGRGITVSRSWRTSFLSFYNDMYATYLSHCNQHGEKNTSIDRINNNRGYGADNCRWATRTEQMRNSRNVVLVQFRGVEKPMACLADEFGIRKSTFYKRIKSGMPVAQIIKKYAQKS